MMSRLMGFGCGIAVILLVGSFAAASVLEVPSGYPTIQLAIEAASSGDTVQVEPGFYHEKLDFLGKPILVMGDGPETTILDGSGLGGPVVRFASEEGSGSVLDGFRIVHGEGELINDPVFGMVHCGGGMLINSASPTILNCIFDTNASWGGAGLCVNGGTPTITDCTFRNNTSEGHGGGVYALHSTPTFERCRFESNVASWGGGMTCTDLTDAIITDCDFVANNTLNVGGGMFIRSSSSPTVTGCTFVSNFQTSNPLGSGGGICVYGSGTGGGPCYPVIADCLFENNEVNGDGGGMSNAYDSHSAVSNCVFRGNTCGRDGGGVACVGAHEPDVPSNGTFHSCLFEDNVASDRGGGFFVRASEPSMMNCDLRGNSCGESGGGLHFFEGPASTVMETRLCGNSLEQIDGAFVSIGGIVVDPECSACSGDITGDGTVGVDDVLELISSFGPCDGCPADVDDDGIVGVDDILIVLSAWGDCP
ncbi:MAG: right-handed parallel beta-helix repeat-containing protein [Phycisphaerales bacterium]|nr:right-handed parallel beta-helix repeat-containing protein [Phycisphaerales bacterium]